MNRILPSRTVLQALKSNKTVNHINRTLTYEILPRRHTNPSLIKKETTREKNTPKRENDLDLGYTPERNDVLWRERSAWNETTVWKERTAWNERTAWEERITWRERQIWREKNVMKPFFNYTIWCKINYSHHCLAR